MKDAIDGVGVDAGFQRIQALRWLSSGSLAVTEYQRLRIVDLTSASVTTLAVQLGGYCDTVADLGVTPENVIFCRLGNPPPGPGFTVGLYSLDGGHFNLKPAGVPPYPNYGPLCGGPSREGYTAYIEGFADGGWDVGVLRFPLDGGAANVLGQWSSTETLSGRLFIDIAVSSNETIYVSEGNERTIWRSVGVGDRPTRWLTLSTSTHLAIDSQDRIYLAAQGQVLHADGGLAGTFQPLPSSAYVSFDEDRHLYFTSGNAANGGVVKRVNVCFLP